MLSQLQFPGMPAPAPVAGEKSRTAAPTPEPHGEIVKGGYDPREQTYGEGGEWATHDDIGSGIRYINQTRRGEKTYDPGKDYSQPGTPWRASVGDVTYEAEVPIQSAQSGSLVYSPQQYVSRRRVEQLRRAPETSGRGRMDPVLEQPDLPWVAQNPAGEMTVYDGNHRMTRALLDNEMFQPVNLTRLGGN